MKEKKRFSRYETPKLEEILFSAEDIVTASLGEDNDGNQGEWDID